MVVDSMKKEWKHFKKNIKTTWTYLKKCKISLIGYGIASILECILGAIIPLVSAQVILNLTSGILEQLLLSALVMIFIYFLSDIASLVKGLVYRKIYQATLVNLQIAIARETLKLEIKEIDKESSGFFIDRINRDTAEIASTFMDVTYWISYVISNIGILIAIFFLNKFFFLFAIVTSITIFLIDKKRLQKEYEIRKNVKILEEKKTGLTSEIVRGIRDIKILNASNNILKQTSDKIIQTSTEAVKMLHTRSKYRFFVNITHDVFDLLFILLGIFLYQHHLVTIPAFTIAYYYTNDIKRLLNGITQLMEIYKNFLLATDRIYEVIHDKRFQKESFGETHIPKLEGSIKFQDISFAYNEKPILKGMSFEIKPNQKVAFVGKSGVGKSTIFNLITRLYHSNSGSIFLDGHDIEKLDCNTIRNNMSIITQSPYIFNFSIKENLLLARKDATMKEIKEACKMACIDEFIMGLENQYDTILGENGVILSGGQKQRLAIARALLMKTEIILFDEATSALDNETQSNIQEAIDNLTGEYTILIIAHRLSTIIDCDKIFVIEDGKIIDQGTHKELLKHCKFYKHLYEKDMQA